MHIDELKLTKPCCESWNEMDGDHRRRHCELCDRDVINLSAMTEAETHRFLDRTDHACIRYVYDATGEVVFVHPQVRKQRRGLRRLMGAAALVPLLVGAAACDGATDEAEPEAVAVEVAHEEQPPIVNAAGMARLQIDDTIVDAHQCDDEESHAEADTEDESDDFDPYDESERIRLYEDDSVVGVW